MSSFLRSISFLLLFLAACSAPYKHLETDISPRPSSFRFQPVFEKELYRCTVNGHILFKKYHISGLLFFKTLENGTVRAIYQNELGNSFFDFEWNSSNTFKINQIIPEFDKPALIKTLRKDFEMVLMKNIDSSKEIFLRNRGNEQISRLSIEGGYVYYIEKEKNLVRIENAGRKKTIVTVTVDGKDEDAAMPRRLVFNHHKAKFTIELNKIEAYADE